MNEWIETSLGDCMDFLNGYAFKSIYFTEDKSDIVLIKGENLGKGQILWEQSKYWKKEDEEKLSRYILKENDLLIAMDRPWVGGGIKYAFIKKGDPKSFLVQRVGCIRAKTDISQYFLRYIVASESFSLHIKNIMGGVGVPHISPSQIKFYKFFLPPLPIQNLIASILSAYDDLIETNLKRIKLLEEIAQRTYEEWFVKFRINGEQLPIDESTGLPLGWERKPFYELIDFKEGPGLRNTQYRETGIPFLNIRVIKDDEVDLTKVQFLDPIEVENKYRHFLLNENDHVISTSGTLGRVVTIRTSHLPICLNTSLIRMRPLDVSFGKWLIKHTITNPKFKETMESYANGSAQLNFGPIHLKQIKLVAPPQEVAMNYEKFAEPVEELIKKLKDQNIKLKLSRDILLPRLMSGTINVES